MIGTRIAGRYRVDAQIGVGGMGIVYRAHDTTLRRDVALKVIAPHRMQQEGARSRFLREAQALAGLSHPNIVTIHDLSEDTATQTIFIVMELLQGRSLRQCMAHSDRPPFFVMALQMCRALEAAHLRGILHRDIKPENIFICRDGTLKLMDFGLARLLGSAAAPLNDHAGTVAYMSPEQLRGETLDAPADLYALGVLFYEYLCGATPFAAENPGTLVIKQLTEEAPPLHERVPNLPDAINDVVMRLLHKDSNARFPTVTALRERLETLFVPGTESWRFFTTAPPLPASLPNRDAARLLSSVSHATIPDFTEFMAQLVPSQAVVPARPPSRHRRNLVLATVLAVIGACMMFAAGQRLQSPRSAPGMPPLPIVGRE